jgi:hypothetical protein
MKTAQKSAREIVPLFIADTSTFCKSLRQHLSQSGTDAVPSHLSLLNLLAKSAGYRNYQALRAVGPAIPAMPPALPVAAPAPAPVPKAIAIPRGSALPRTTRRALTHFDTAGRLMRWPTQFSVQQCALWALWVRLPAKRDLTEPEVNQYLSGYNAFDDPVTLRRELVNARLLWRTQDCSVYRKEMRRPPAEVRDFLATLFEQTGRPAKH